MARAPKHELKAGGLARFNGSSIDGAWTGSGTVTVIDPHVNAAEVTHIDGKREYASGKIHLRIARVRNARGREYLVHSYTLQPLADNPGGRPRKYASDAERSAAFRERWARKTFRMDPETARTIERLSEFADESESTVLHSLVTFALLNRSWFTLGLFGKRLAGEQQGKRRRASVESETELESDDA